MAEPSGHVRVVRVVQDRHRLWAFSRPDYDKPHRCPGWAGGGMRYARKVRCDGGHVHIDYDRRGWQWRTHRCCLCGLLVLPYVIRWIDPRWLSYWASTTWRDARYWVADALERGEDIG